MSETQTTCQLCDAPLVYTNGAVPGSGTPPMNPSGCGRDRTLVCQSVHRTGSHDLDYGDAGMCDAEGCERVAQLQASIGAPRYCGRCWTALTPMRRCSVCQIRETADYPFPSAEWDLCFNHGTTRSFVLSGRRIAQAWDGLAWVTLSDIAEEGAK